MTRHTVDVLRPGGSDPDGDPLPGQVLELAGVLLAPRGESSEDDARGEQVTAGLTAYCPPDADVRATDRLRVRSGPYRGAWDVVGEPAAWGWTSPRRRLTRPGVVVALTRSSG